MTDMREKTAQQMAGLRQSMAAIDASDAKIKGAARKRLKAVQDEIAALRPKVLIDAQVEERYLALVQESGRLQRLI